MSLLEVVAVLSQVNKWDSNLFINYELWQIVNRNSCNSDVFALMQNIGESYEA